MTAPTDRPGTIVPGRSHPDLATSLRTAARAYREAAANQTCDLELDLGAHLADLADLAAVYIDVPAVPVRRQVTASFLERVAQIYRDNIDGKPVQAVAAVLGIPRYAAGRYVQLARQHGDLPPTSQGKPRA